MTKLAQVDILIKALNENIVSAEEVIRYNLNTKLAANIYYLPAYRIIQ